MYDLIGDVHGYAHALVEVEFGLCERSEAIYLSSRTVLQTRHGAAVMDCHVAPLLAETTGVMDCRVATLLTGTLGLWVAVSLHFLQRLQLLLRYYFLLRMV